MQIPRMLQKGQPFKQSVVAKINEIIAYLKTQRIVGDLGNTRVNQGTSGLMLSVNRTGGSSIRYIGGGGSGESTFAKIAKVKEFSPSTGKLIVWISQDFGATFNSETEIYYPQLALCTPIPTGTLIMVYESQTYAEEGSELL